MRTCEFCGVNIEHKHLNAKTCGSVECGRKQSAKSARKHWHSHPEYRAKKHVVKRQQERSLLDEQYRSGQGYRDKLQFNKLYNELIKRLKSALYREAVTERRLHKKDKYCKICQKTHSVTNFSKDRSSPDGLNNRCKTCDALLQRYKKYGIPQSVQLQRLEEQNHACAYCGVILDGEWHIDHIHPRSKGGSDNRENLCVSCPDCNLKKGDRSVEEFRSRWA